MIPYNRRAWLRLLFAGRGSLEQAVISRVTLFGALAVAIAALDDWTKIPARLPTGFHEVAGVVIGLVLAFRTNTAYARFWEGRTLWGGIVNASRNLARVVTYHASLNEAESHDFRVWIVAFVHGVRARLRGEQQVPEAAELIPPGDYQQMLAAPHPALYSASELSRRIGALSGRLDPIIAGVAEHELGNLVNCLGGCEKILRTPTPLGYILLMERGAFLYLVTLPAALVGRVGWLTPLVTIGVAYLVLMIETLGNELDNPFGLDPSDLPLDTICSNISFDVLGVGRGPQISLPKGVGKVEH